MTMVTIEEVKRRLWNGAGELRGSMDASRYKDYMLGLMFYKFLSDKTLRAYANNAHITGSGEELEREYETKYQKFFALEGSRNNDLTDMLKKDLGGYCILPQYLYQKWLIDINEGKFELQKVVDSLADFEQSIVGSEDAGDFKGLFAGLDLTDTALGSTLKDRSDNIKSLILLFSDLNMIELQENDILGDAYEYLIGMFAMQSGKKAGEFYTPHNVSEVLARIVACSTKITSIYERLNEEIRRRTKVIGIFPNPDSYLRLVTTYLMEYAEDWSVSRCYIRKDSLASLLPAAA